MTDAILIGVLVVLFIAALLAASKHLKRKSGCCGSSRYQPKRKKLSHVIAEKTFTVKGMHCEHCQRRVEEAVNDIVGVACRVDLKSGIAKVSYEREVDDHVIIKRIEQAGYTVCG